jgi:hypothetical protein
MRLGHENRVNLDSDLYLLGYASTLVKDSDQLGWGKLMSSISDGGTIVLA